ncbi:hypothetical protein KIPB_003786 [Kipferlia bialata]|uniref:Uncharacterized protein n=1 Tax=Kipferlia bialata TaxID=797122 RepID=A0A9K3GG22_9EUKA|nr:hypothetical protein KIPB_003786 [Kipferlia bialata]|eukprot:g3786.t1
MSHLYIQGGKIYYPDDAHHGEVECVGTTAYGTDILSVYKAHCTSSQTSDSVYLMSDSGDVFFDITTDLDNHYNCVYVTFASDAGSLHMYLFTCNVCIDSACYTETIEIVCILLLTCGFWASVIYLGVRSRRKRRETPDNPNQSNEPWVYSTSDQGMGDSYQPMHIEGGQGNQMCSSTAGSSTLQRQTVAREAAREDEMRRNLAAQERLVRRKEEVERREERERREELRQQAHFISDADLAGLDLGGMALSRTQAMPDIDIQPMPVPVAQDPYTASAYAYQSPGGNTQVVEDVYPAPPSTHGVPTYPPAPSTMQVSGTTPIGFPPVGGNMSVVRSGNNHTESFSDDSSSSYDSSSSF